MCQLINGKVAEVLHHTMRIVGRLLPVFLFEMKLRPDLPFSLDAGLFFF